MSKNMLQEKAEIIRLIDGGSISIYPGVGHVCIHCNEKGRDFTNLFLSLSELAMLHSKIENILGKQGVPGYRQR